ncbi:MAG: helix-turn-helix transcriptional regulator [Clostridia bacterium]|nr:helix-turn-helix transcriptional regulator [Clostridia bacterium]
MLYEIYYTENIREFGEKCLNLIKIFIPYNQAYFIIIDDEGRLMPELSVFNNIDEKSKSDFIKKYFYKDYINDICSFSKSVCYRDTDILTDEKRKNSEIYKYFFKPQNLDTGCGLIIMNNERVCCFLNILRSKYENDISDYEFEVLKTFMPHFEKNILNFYKNKLNLDFSHFTSYNLSKREKEIASLVLKGCSNEEIGDCLNISIATVKKHLNNIFKKTGVTRRTQLFK